VPLLARSIWDVLFERHMGFFWLLVVLVALPLGWRLGRETRVLALWVGLSLLAIAGAFLVTPNHVTWHVQTALPRLWCQLALPAALLVVEAALALYRPGGVASALLSSSSGASFGASSPASSSSVPPPA